MSHDDVEVTVEHRTELSRYEAWVDGALAGAAHYRKRGDDRFVFTHTEIDDAYEGKGVGSRLIRAALDDVRRQNGSVIARCPFVARYIRDHAEYADLLTENP
jgi:predicted GNAT family acetyltransferase